MNVTHENYDNELARKWAWQMERVGFDVVHYNGRNCYEGPAVIVSASERNKVIRACDCDIQSDNMGHDYVLYPTFRAKMVEEEIPVTEEEEEAWAGDQVNVLKMCYILLERIRSDIDFNHDDRRRQCGNLMDEIDNLGI